VLYLAGASDESGDEVVETRAGVVEKVPEQHSPVGVDSWQRHLERVLKGVSLEISTDGIAVNVGEPFNLFTKNVVVEHRSHPLAFVIPEEIAHGSGGVDVTR
jgi:hypothetical protein